MKYEKTLLLIKPGIIERGMVGEILQRFERKGLDILGLKMCKPKTSQYKELYKEHEKAYFYQRLMDYMTSGHIIALVVGGVDAVKSCRTLLGSTNPQEANSGSIRGDYGLFLPENVVHASDSQTRANTEIKIFFAPSEIRKHKKS